MAALLGWLEVLLNASGASTRRSSAPRATSRATSEFAIASAKRPLAGHQAIELTLGVSVGEDRRDTCQAQPHRAGVAAEPGLDQSRVDQLALSLSHRRMTRLATMNATM